MSGIEVTDLLLGGAVVVLREGDPRHVDDAVEVLVEEGLRCLEITTNTPGWAAAVRRGRDTFGDRVRWGVGTALTREHVLEAAEAGAEFVVAPDTEPEVASAAAEAGLAWLPGALTPTEIVRAWRLGATAVKVFPASALGGPGYIAAVRAPLEHIPLIPTGGVGPTNVADYLSAGAVGVGLGGSLVGDALSSGDLDGLRSRARAVAAALGASR
ncbi:bifunctional 4-hydroxy-2-oxoglutarate aldolase/2-dehydro-3-deoxy-phosphogluconate aldolase [Nocardioides sp. BYT-33-1]|jgi:2-dehydro-3-deoxyphosphogluconate aldolase/(4S)-4-hydroxy-2-oxoglutarate aldolase|uniref:bifunctional 4-hydroxy-2-oxoglutarate aldolase/2-dehydro-3-deoxy-phosphogluconate aldolase n=1 Tax=Nocardioides sp. BYT-33-1 TaxID=3416952 RepID=UPI003F5375E8